VNKIPGIKLKTILKTPKGEMTFVLAKNVITRKNFRELRLTPKIKLGRRKEPAIWTMDRVQKPNNHVQHTPSSESFQAYQFLMFGIFIKYYFELMR
jgi:hypothetical protein